MAGQASAHAPQRIQSSSGPVVGNSASVGAMMQLLVFTIGICKLGKVKPIIGPPMITRCFASATNPQLSSKKPTGVPTSANTFCGRLRVSPTTVTIREINGMSCSTACAIAKAVPTFCMTMPISSGRRPAGTSLLVKRWINCFSPPLGYLAGTTRT